MCIVIGDDEPLPLIFLFEREMSTPVVRRIKEVLESSPEVAAAYLFGSAARKGKQARDLDILLLPYPDAGNDLVYFAVAYRLAEALHIPAEDVDILLFDLKEADPEVLYEAVDGGILLKNDLPDLLSERIEELSSYFIVNEFVLRNAKRLEAERLEEFCGTGC
jgi:predicted nucleotidyltransferase